MTQIFPHLIPDIHQWPVNIQSNNRQAFISRLNDFVYNNLKSEYNDEFYNLISKTIYLEKQRIKLHPWRVDPQGEAAYWNNINKELENSKVKSNEAELQSELLKKIINRYNEEIVGNFKPGIFKFARIFLTASFKRLFCKFFDKGKWRWGKKSDLQQRIVIKGNVELVRTLFEKGNIVIVPTHYSNLDSMMIGYAMDTNVGLPFFSYGAGLNLLNVEIVGYFINRLGAFRVDRRKKNAIYLECLKSMTSYSITEGVNCLFFPGGTRSRNGETERKLKLGLIGSVIEAQRLLIENGDNKKVFVVPLNIGYHFVLEAAELINQHLVKTGLDKYKRDRKNSMTFKSNMKFIKNIYTKKSEVYLSFGDPIDVFGNLVDAEGNSIDKQGNIMEMEDYFTFKGEISQNRQREHIYSRMLGEKVVESYRKFNVILSSNVVAFIAFRLFYRDYGNSDLIQLMNQNSSNFTIDFNEFKDHVNKLIGIILDMEKSGSITISYESWQDTDKFISEGLAKLGIYHPAPVLKYFSGDKIKCGDIRILYFYHNRLLNYGFEELMGWVQIENVKSEG